MAQPSPPKDEARQAKPPEPRAPSPSRQAKPVASPELTRDQRKQVDSDRKKKQRAADTLNRRIAELENRIADREAQVKELEAAIASPGFYDNPGAARDVIDRHQALMWEVGDLMGQWEALQEHASDSSQTTLDS